MPAAKLTEAGQVAGQVTGQVAARILAFCEEPRKGSEIQALVEIRHRETFLNNYLNPLLERGWIERTIPEKPRSRLQRYRLMQEGRAWLASNAGASALNLPGPG